MYKKIISILFLCVSTAILAKPIHIVAAENFYGNLAKQIGGPYVEVISILNNPRQDPHLFSSSPSTAKAIAGADLVVYNGIDYDPWMQHLLAPSAHQPKSAIVVGELMGKKTGDNPHIWYQPDTMMVYAKTLVDKLSELDPAHQDYFRRQLAVFKQGHDAMLANIARLKKHYQGTPVLAAESVFNYMAEAVGLSVRGQGFQLSVMNETSPKISDLQEVENNLNQRLVKLFIYNNQVTDPVVDKMKALAKKHGIPVLGVSEIQPLNQDYLRWMESELSALERALGKKP